MSVLPLTKHDTGITTEKLHSLEELESKIEEISHLKETFEQLESGKAEAEKELKRLLSAKSNEESDTRDQLFELEKERDQKMKKLHEMENSKEKVEEKVKALTKELKEKTASLNKEIASRDTKISDLQRRLDESTSSSSPDLDTMAKLQEKVLFFEKILSNFPSCSDYSPIPFIR